MSILLLVNLEYLSDSLLPRVLPVYVFPSLSASTRHLFFDSFLSFLIFLISLINPLSSFTFLILISLVLPHFFPLPLYILFHLSVLISSFISDSHLFISFLTLHPSHFFLINFISFSHLFIFFISFLNFFLHLSLSHPFTSSFTFPFLPRAFISLISLSLSLPCILISSSLISFSHLFTSCFTF